MLRDQRRIARLQKEVFAYQIHVEAESVPDADLVFWPCNAGQPSQR
jgi:hypothetical protein